MKIGQGANKKNLCFAKSHFFFSVLKIGGQLKQKLIMYFVYHKREDPFNQFKGCVLHYSCIRSACRVRPHPQNDSGSTHYHIFHFMEAEFQNISDLIHNCLFDFWEARLQNEKSLLRISREKKWEREKESKKSCNAKWRWEVIKKVFKNQKMKGVRNIFWRWVLQKILQCKYWKQISMARCCFNRVNISSHNRRKILG